MRAPAIVVLGCRSGSEALTRRVRAARDAFFAREGSVIVACGGRAWAGVVEADEVARQLRDGGVPDEAIVRERCSLDTLDNARFAASILGRHGVDAVILVTCSWHLPRAKRLFERAGLRVEGLGVEPPDATPIARAYRWGREIVTSFKDARRRVGFG